MYMYIEKQYPTGEKFEKIFCTSFGPNKWTSSDESNFIYGICRGKYVRALERNNIYHSKVYDA